MAIDGRSVAFIGIGSIVAYSAIKGKSLGDATRSFLTGRNPASAADTQSIDSPAVVAPDLANNSVTSDVPPVTGNPSGNKALGRLMASAFGWGTGNEWNALDQLWTRESSWSNTADNSSSHAYGIAQALPSTKYPLAGQPPSQGGRSDARTQIAWGLSYIKSRYGSPSQAWAHELANSWY